jgi:predicted acyl esterase
VSYHPTAHAGEHAPLRIPSGTRGRHDVIEATVDLRAAMRDGVRLAGDLYRPANDRLRVVSGRP